MTPNVAVFASSFAPHLGGVEELSGRLVRQLRQRGGDSIVVTDRLPADLPAREVIDGIPVCRERFRLPVPRPRHLAGWAVATRATRRGVVAALLEHRSQVVHVQCVGSNGYYALRAAQRLNVPLVVSLQGERFMDAGRAVQRSPLAYRESRALLAAADVVTGCSRQVIDEAVGLFGAGLAGKARVVRNGADLAAVRSVEPERRERPYLFALGRMVPHKGFDVLIEGFGRIAADVPELDLVIAGDGPERERLRTAAGRLGGRVIFLGTLAPERAFGLYAGARAFVLAARHESHGIVVAEAMAAGTPVIATRVGGVPETVRDGSNGLLIDGGDPTEMARGLRRLLDDPEGADRRRAQASIDVEAYDWAHIADQYEQCYADAGVPA